jgi:hypothetical protein
MVGSRPLHGLERIEPCIMPTFSLIAACSLGRPRGID